MFPPRGHTARSATPALTFTALLLLGAVACRPAPAQQVQVVATEYAFSLPASLPSGIAELRLVNQGRVDHEMALGRLREGKTADSVLARLAANGDPTDLTDGVVGILIVSPGDTSIGALRTELLRGRTYMLICQFRDADSLPPHIAMGMQASFTVN